jgi:hypothetical protein
MNKNLCLYLIIFFVFILICYNLKTSKKQEKKLKEKYRSEYRTDLYIVDVNNGTYEFYSSDVSRTSIDPYDPDEPLTLIGLATKYNTQFKPLLTSNSKGYRVNGTYIYYKQQNPPVSKLIIPDSVYNSLGSPIKKLSFGSLNNLNTNLTDQDLIILNSNINSNINYDNIFNSIGKGSWKNELNTIKSSFKPIIGKLYELSPILTARFYDDCDFKGKMLEFGLGQYKVNKSISSIKVPSGLKVTLYEHNNFNKDNKGRYNDKLGRLIVLSSDAKCLAGNPHNFNDMTSSIKIEQTSSSQVILKPSDLSTSSATLYINPRYNTVANRIYHGQKHTSAQNNRPAVRSVTVPPGIAVKIKAFGGINDYLSNDTDSISGRFGVKNLHENSIEFEATNNVITFYEDCDYKGKYTNLIVDDIPQNNDYNLDRLRKYGIENDSISSIKVPKGFSVTLYEHNDFQGNSITVNGDIDCLTKLNFNDMTSSLILSKN